MGHPLFECEGPLKGILRGYSSSVCTLKILLRVNSSGTCLQEFIHKSTVVGSHLKKWVLLARRFCPIPKEWAPDSHFSSFNCTNTFKLL
jgi:hypothetical protein